MQKRAISDGRRFSLKKPVRTPLLAGQGVETFLLCFEGGQSLAPEPGEASYQVLEGDAVFASPDASEKARKGQVLVGSPERIENLGGGLLVVLETRARG